MTAKRTKSQHTEPTKEKLNDYLEELVRKHKAEEFQEGDTTVQKFAEKSNLSYPIARAILEAEYKAGKVERFENGRVDGKKCKIYRPIVNKHR